MSEAPPPVPPVAAVRRLERSRRDRWIGGVCGGLGEYFGVDVVLVRLAAILLTLAAGAGIVVYVLAWILIPEAEEAPTAAAPGTTPAAPPAPGGARVVAGAILVGLGALLLLEMILPVSLDDRYLWPILLIVIGAVVIARRDRS